jgi:adenylate cyclase
VRLIQLATVVFFGSLFVFSAKAHGSTALSPVPAILGAYLALTLLGLVWAWRFGLPDWAVYGSIFIDVALLLTLIWSFHIQYGQPASFALKSPTLLYAFIFIALRALRFQARFVVAAGAAAAIGWAGFVVAVVHAEGSRAVITRDYVHYLTSNSVLIGAEVDKVVSILVVAAVLSLALRRARSLLVQAVDEQAAAKSLSRFFDEPVANRIRQSGEGALEGKGVRRKAAILYVDLRGFSALAAELEPSEVVAILTEYQRRLVPLIQREGGTIDKYLGDGIMATFGAVKASDRYAADALRAVDAVDAESLTWADGDVLARLRPGGVNMAVASGPVVAGPLGEQRLEFTVVGSAVNLAAKLEKHNKVLGSRALAPWGTFETARDQGYSPGRAVARVQSRLEGVSEPAISRSCMDAREECAADIPCVTNSLRPRMLQ